jgi:ubiquinone biosynthesis protein
MRRLGPIIRVLARHGFGHVLGLRVPRVGRVARIPAPRRLVMALQELGPTFVKFGQMLSTRADLLPEAYITELRTLTEQVPPFDTAVARRIVETELKKPIAELFREFADAPVASGSIGQVYHAVLQTGEAVVVKVKRPDIEKIMMADLDLLDPLAGLVERVEELKAFRPRMIVEEFRRSVRRELDFVSEASFTAKIAEELADNPRVRCPAVYWDLTTSSVLVLERLPGVSLNRKQELAAMAVDRKQLARDLAEVFLHQFFKSGLFHADPHPGNILVTPEGKIGLVDFGMAGRLDPDLRRALGTSLIALTRRDLDIITDIYLEIGAVSDDTDVERLKSDLSEMLDKYYGIPIHCLDFRRALGDGVRIARTHHVLLPRDFVLLGRSFVTMVMMARELDPEFDLSAVAKPYALSLMADKVSPERLAHSALGHLWYVAQSLHRLPRDLRTLSRKLLGGSLQFTLRVSELDGFIRELDRATNRLAFSVIVSAIVIGSSVLLHAKVNPLMDDLPGVVGRFFHAHMPNVSALGLAGFLFAGVLGMLLSVAIWRSGRM